MANRMRQFGPWAGVVAAIRGQQRELTFSSTDQGRREAAGIQLSRFPRRLTQFQFAGLPIVVGDAALDHFVAPLVARHDEGGEVAAAKQNAPNAATMRTGGSKLAHGSSSSEIDIIRLLPGLSVNDKTGVQFLQGGGKRRAGQNEAPIFD
jgi:hypothetical protein